MLLCIVDRISNKSFEMNNVSFLNLHWASFYLTITSNKPWMLVRQAYYITHNIQSLTIILALYLTIYFRSKKTGKSLALPGPLPIPKPIASSSPVATTLNEDFTVG